MAPNGSPEGNLTKELLEKQIALLKESLEKQIATIQGFLEKQAFSLKENLEKQIIAGDEYLGKQIASAKKSLQGYMTLVITVMIALMGIIGTTFFNVQGLSNQIGDLKGAFASQIAEVKIALARSDTTLAKKSDVAEGMASLSSTMRASLDRIEKRLSATPPNLPGAGDADALLILTPLDRLVLRTVLKVAKTGKAVEVKIGDKADGKPMPADITDEIPKFRNYSYTYDLSGALLIVSPAGRVVAILEG